jgi:hypothetical protein
LGNGTNSRLIIPNNRLLQRLPGLHVHVFEFSALPKTTA